LPATFLEAVDCPSRVAHQDGIVGVDAEDELLAAMAHEFEGRRNLVAVSPDAVGQFRMNNRVTLNAQIVQAPFKNCLVPAIVNHEYGQIARFGDFSPVRPAESIYQERFRYILRVPCVVKDK